MGAKKDTVFATEAENFAKFLTRASGSPFVAASVVREMLLAAGFEELDETAHWCLERGKRYFFTRNGAAVHAFAIGAKFELERGAFAMAGAHTDNPALRLKPRSLTTACGAVLASVETYGGGIWQTWFDRNLGVAGKALVRVERADGQLEVQTRVVSIKRPLFYIPTVAPHLDQPYANGFQVNKEIHLRALLTDTSAAAAAGKAAEDEKLSATMVAASGSPKHHPGLVALVARELGVAADAVVGVDLRLCDCEPATVGGLAGDYVCGQGIDNLNGTYCTTTALIRATADLREQPNVCLVNLFDHEECGSLSAQGAGANVVADTIERILRGVAAGMGAGAVDIRELAFRAARRSLILSADNSHAVHPNYAEKHPCLDPPMLNRGPVVKHNVNQRYASDTEGTAVVLLLGQTHGIPVQEFVIRQDTNCGTTIGPMTGAHTGIRTVDIGNAQLGMHSIREMVGAADIEHMTRLIAAFFTDYSKIILA